MVNVPIVTHLLEFILLGDKQVLVSLFDGLASCRFSSNLINATLRSTFLALLGFVELLNLLVLQPWELRDL